MTPLVSIVIPCYKGESFLPETIESCLAQTHRELEVIVVNDASPDRCGEIAESFQNQDARVRLVRHVRNLGVSCAWNTGMAESRGEFILRLAQDDVLLPEAVARMLAVFEARPEADVVYAGYRILAAGGKVVEAPKPVAEESALFRSDNHLGLCVMIRRRLYETGLRYDPAIRAAEDLDFFVRAFDAGFRFARCAGEPLLLFRQHDQAGSVTQNARQNLETARILARREKSFWKRWAIYAYRHGEAAYRYRREENWQSAMSVSAAGLYHAPLSPRLWKQLMTSLLRIQPRG